MRILTSTLSLLLFFCIITEAYSKVENPKTYTRSGNMINLTLNQKQYQLEICTPSMIRIRMAGQNGFEANESLMVTRYQWDEVPFTFAEKKNELELKTAALTVKITTN